MKQFYKTVFCCLFVLATASFCGAQTLNFESETVGSFNDFPGVSQATLSRSGIDITGISSVASGIYYGFDKDNPATYTYSIGYNSIYFYMGTGNGDPLTSIAITRTAGGVFDFDKVRVSPYPSSATYDTPFDVYVQGFKGGIAKTSKVALSTLIHGNGGAAEAVDFDLTGNPDFKGVDKVLITTSIVNDYTAIDNLELTPVTTTPVTLSGFSGVLSGSRASFSWASGVESNISHYELEKGQSGKDFSFVKRIAAKGSNQAYMTTVEQPTSKADYRLKIVEQDGHISYYKDVITLIKSQDPGFSVYPNPATDYIRVFSPLTGIFAIYDVSGKRVLSKKLSGGVTKLDITGFAAGIYYARFMGRTLSFVKR